MRIIFVIFGTAFGCEKGWHQDPMGNCLKLSRTERSWHDAQDDCIRYDSHIIQISNQDYNQVVSYGRRFLAWPHSTVFQAAEAYGKLDIFGISEKKRNF